jgi:hypothetical protein
MLDAMKRTKSETAGSGPGSRSGMLNVVQRETSEGASVRRRTRSCECSKMVGREEVGAPGVPDRRRP